MANQRLSARRRAVRLATVLLDLDSKMGGLQPSDLIILAGRPSMGKTALVDQHCRSRSLGRKRLDWQTAQTSRRSPQRLRSRRVFLARNVGRATGHPHHVRASPATSEKIRRGKINEKEYKRMVSHRRNWPAGTAVHRSDWRHFDRSACRACPRNLKRQQGLDLLIVDYLQLLTGSSRRASENRVQEVSADHDQH